MDGILYGRTGRRGAWTDSAEAMPRQYKNKVLEASYSAVYAGHLGWDNILSNISKLYY